MSNIQLVLTIVATLVAVLGLVVAVIQLIISILINKVKLKEYIKIPKNSASLLLVLIFGPLSLWLWTRPSPDPSRYGFESGTLGWTYESYINTQGVIEVARSSDRAKFGKRSLKLTVDLEGGHDNRSQGEAFVEIAPQTLSNKPITIWVYVPEGAVGERERPNGIQVFVKDADKDWRAEYGTWWNITRAKVNSWQQVTLTPSTTAPPDGSMAAGFDPTQIKAVGVRIGIGENSKAKYKGPVYIDSVDWPQ